MAVRAGNAVKSHWLPVWSGTRAGPRPVETKPSARHATTYQTAIARLVAAMMNASAERWAYSLFQSALPTNTLATSQCGQRVKPAQPSRVK